jgi:hypothetical protein
MTDLDSILDLAEAQTNMPSDRLLSRGAHVVLAMRSRYTRGRAHYTPAEDAYILQNAGILTDGQIAAALGRTHYSVHIRAERHLRAYRMTKHPDYITANQAAKMLQIDGHKITWLCKTGELPGEILPSDIRSTWDFWRIRRDKLKSWLVNPANWVYFDWQRIRDKHLRRLCELRAERWGDVWWTTKQAAQYHGVDGADIVRYIKNGWLYGRQIKNKSGRNRTMDGWGMWFVRRNQVVTTKVYKLGMGNSFTRQNYWSREADKFCLLARGVGLSNRQAGTLMSWDYAKASARALDLIRDGRAQQIAPDLHYRDSLVFVDWKLYRQRFPTLARAMDKFKRRGPMCYRDRMLVRAVLYRWSEWFGLDKDRNAMKAGATAATAKTLRKVYARMVKLGVDVYQEIER